MQVITIVFLLMFLFLVGCFLIIAGLRPSNLAECVEEGNAKFYRDYGSSWRERLFAWRVVDSERAVGGVLKDVITFWELIQVPHRFAMGITMILFVLVYTAWVIVSKGAIIQQLQPQLVITMLFLIGFGMILGGCLGYAVGFWRARRVVYRRVMYADVRSRRASDYRSSWLRWPLGLVVSLNVVLVLVLSSSLDMQSLMRGTLWVIAVSMCIMFLLGELLIACIATMPRLVVTLDLSVAQHADDLMRALIIDDIQTTVIMGTIFILIVQWSLSSAWITSAPLLIFIQAVMVVLLLLNIAPTGLRKRDKGRLGGKITGWAWQHATLQ